MKLYFDQKSMQRPHIQLTEKTRLGTQVKSSEKSNELILKASNTEVSRSVRP